LSFQAELGAGPEGGASDQVIFGVGPAGSVVLERPEIRRWWSEDEVVYVETREVRIALAPVG
jgi:hypothetical protein